MITILDYDELDATDVLNLNLASLNYALTPELVGLIRRLDPRPFPFFGIYAVENGVVASQVCIYRLMMMTICGPEEIGAVSAVCTHPAYSGRGIASRLLDEAHERMRTAGLRFSTLGTSRHRGAYSLYRRQGYKDFFIPSFVFAPCSNEAVESKVRAERAGAENLHLCDELFERAAAGRLGFAIRHKPFMPTMVATGEVRLYDVWLLWHEEELVGYALAQEVSSVLLVRNLLLTKGINAAAAVAALAQDREYDYVRVRVDEPSVAESLRCARYPALQPDWSTFMVKPLDAGVAALDAREHFGVASEKFLISCLDVT